MQRPPSPCLEMWPSLCSKNDIPFLPEKGGVSGKVPTWAFFIAADPQAIPANAVGERSTGYG